jgi:tetratricopeptide (TPR) repeat protein
VEYKETMDYLRHFLQAAKKENNKEDEIMSLVTLGRCSVELGNYEEAAQFHENALALISQLPDKTRKHNKHDRELELYSSLGSVYRHLHRTMDAENCFLKVIEIDEENSDSEKVILAHGNLGLVYTDMGRFHQAIQELERTLQFFEDINDYTRFAHARFNLGYAYHRMGDNKRAREYGESALKLLKQINHPTVDEVKRQLATWH